MPTVTHRRGGKVVIEFEPLEVQLLKLYIRDLDNMLIPDLQSLVKTMLGEQLNFVAEQMQSKTLDKPLMDAWKKKYGNPN